MFEDTAQRAGTTHMSSLCPRGCLKGAQDPIRRNPLPQLA